MRAYIVVDLGFGDSGKGALTDFLVRRYDAGVVVRYNGGAQAGHNVVTPEGNHHTFSQFGAGAFNPNVKTYLSKYVVVHPEALLVEGEILQGKGVPDPYSRLRLSEEALLITPYHQSANRIRELLRGENRHGTCGVGVGEAFEDAQRDAGNRILAGDLNNPGRLHKKLGAVREKKREEITALCKGNPLDHHLARECEIFEREDVIDAWISSVSRISELDLVVPDTVLECWLRETKDVVFEGAQGVLLDADVGFHPYTTWSCCTERNALAILQGMTQDSQIFKIGVMRTYVSRHGPGPLPTETNGLKPMIIEHNKFNEWQGGVRYGWFDTVLARYALGILGGVDCLAVTHMDLLSRLDEWTFCIGYWGNNDPGMAPVVPVLFNDILVDFRLRPSLSLEQRTEVTQAISSVTPVLETCNADTDTVIEKIESLTMQTVGIISHGPSADDMQVLNSHLP